MDELSTLHSREGDATHDLLVLLTAVSYPEADCLASWADPRRDLVTALAECVVHG